MATPRNASRYIVNSMIWLRRGCDALLRVLFHRAMQDSGVLTRNLGKVQRLQGQRPVKRRDHTSVNAMHDIGPSYWSLLIPARPAPIRDRVL